METGSDQIVAANGGRRRWRQLGDPPCSLKTGCQRRDTCLDERIVERGGHALQGSLLPAQAHAKHVHGRIPACKGDAAVARFWQTMRRQPARFVIIVDDIVEVRIAECTRYEHQGRLRSSFRGKVLQLRTDRRRYDDPVCIVFRHLPDEVRLSIDGLIGVAKKNRSSRFTERSLQRRQQCAEKRIGNFVQKDSDPMRFRHSQACRAAAVHVSGLGQGCLDPIPHRLRNPLVVAHGKRDGGGGYAKPVGNEAKGRSVQFQFLPPPDRSVVPRIGHKARAAYAGSNCRSGTVGPSAVINVHQTPGIKRLSASPVPGRGPVPSESCTSSRRQTGTPVCPMAILFV